MTIEEIRERLNALDTNTGTEPLQVRVAESGKYWQIGRPFKTTLCGEGFSVLLHNHNIHWEGSAALNDFVSHAADDIRTLLAKIDQLEAVLDGKLFRDESGAYVEAASWEEGLSRVWWVRNGGKAEPSLCDDEY